MKVLKKNEIRAEELEHLYPSPYFTKCHVKFDDETEDEDLYFGKFQFTERDIYSWITRAASIRFENPGPVTYEKPDGTTRKGTLQKKDQYMIANGKIIFLSSESVENPRELVHQDYFSTQKTDFALPEIVAQMEKAQDQVIRADHKGPFVIAGPAGSGKTTLALHRVAYLLQSPETVNLFTPEKIIVFVQDQGTKEYFSQLLPELGINKVTITTFSEWSMKILGLKDAKYRQRVGKDEYQKNLYEFSKLKILKNLNPKNESFNVNTIFKSLSDLYNEHLDDEQMSLFRKQQTEQMIDKVDLTIALKLFKSENENFFIKEDYKIVNKKQEVVNRSRKRNLEYSLIIVDEFQNYLPEQLKLFQAALKKETRSMVYVGDMAQQTQLGTINSWSEVGEVIPDNRQVKLQKVYRNTKSILEYIRSLDYKVEVPKEVKTGQPVEEFKNLSSEGEMKRVEQIVDDNPDVTVGIISQEKESIEKYKELYRNSKHVHTLTISEAQGVEFEVVILVGTNKNMLKPDSKYTPDLRSKIQKVNKDQLYVALTRAISKLYVFWSK